MEIRSSSRDAFSVGSGIFVSRITGLIRDQVIAAFFGTTLVVDAFNAALRIPNIIRNLLGEGTLSAAFVPVYSTFVSEEGREEDATRLARSMLGAMLAAAALLSALGILLAPYLTRLVAPGFGAEATGLASSMVPILFPMAGAMMIGAWALGVLNSHDEFFLPFVAPVAWNLAQIGGLFLGASQGWEPLIHVLAWSALAGGVLQVAVQLPAVRRRVGSLTPRLEWSWEPVRRVVRNMGPVAGSQGIFQISSYADVFLASFLVQGAVGAPAWLSGPGSLAALYFAQRIAYVPLSLFGVSVAASSLPEMSRRSERRDAVRRRVVNGFFQILFFVFPAAVAMILFGDLAVQVLFQRGDFGAASTAVVSAVLVAYAVGIVASSSVKLFASGFHAMQDTKTPMKYATVGVGSGVVVSALLMRPLGVPGLALGGALGAWLNLGLLWGGLRGRLGGLFDRKALRAVARIAVAGGLAAAVGLGARELLSGWIGTGGTVEALLVLAGTLGVAGVPYLLIVSTPPVVVPSPDDAPGGAPDDSPPTDDPDPDDAVT